MCLAILKPAGRDIPEEALREGWISNPDGGGYGFVDKEGKPTVRKGFFKLREFMEAYKVDVQENADSPFLVHFRIATMGTKGPENTHPFVIDNGLMIHNGTLSGTGAVYGTGKSDTAMFADRFSKDMTFDFVYANKEELNKNLDYNKLVFLYSDKRWVILNEGLGVWDNDVWYSNRTYLRSNYNAQWYTEGWYYD